MAGINQRQLDEAFKQGGSATDAYEAVQRRKQESEQNNLQRNAALSQLLTGGQIKEDAATSERDRNLRDLVTLRETAGPDARITSGDVSYDPRTDIAGRGKKPEPTEFQKVYDRESAKKMAEDASTGGPARRQSDISTLKDVEGKLGRQTNLSGPIIGSIPAGIRSIVMPESAKAQQDFEAIAQRTLKETLGGQFAQKEGEEFFKRAYDPRLPEAMLQQRVTRARQVSQILAQEKQKMQDYAQQTGSMVGYQGMRPEQVADMFNAEMARWDASEGGSGQAPAPQATSSGGLNEAQMRRLQELRAKKESAK